jgi:hypothetical protein
MADYDFRSLSSYDFAQLARDLLQAELGLQLESFCAGPDSGIDFRYTRKRINLIVQCKHYVDSGFPALTSVLRRKERHKIDSLSPTRYILATSVPLTPGRKDEIREILAPHCLEPSDIYGRDDLNNLINRHDIIERQHFKLWLTSEMVLRRVLDSGIFSDSELHLGRIRLRLCRYVQNPSFDRALSLLEKRHYCIIAGIPGIGKTTLAEVLLADLVDRQGFQAFRIAHNLDEIRPIKNTKRKQVFYFDDFLGRTNLENLQRNEDKRLIELIEDVASNENWRFILTTREYILNVAKFRSEAFAHPQVDFTLCVIKLDDYNRPIRARILYNHIYFSDLPKTHKLALLQDKAYEGILRHRNYNPRVVEYMTQTRHACAVAPSLYLSEFTDSLEHPAKIWDHAFRYQISEAARHLLLVLTTLPDEVSLDDLEAAFWTFYRFRQSRFGFSTKSGDWSDALKELDGSFVATQKVGEDFVVSFHNPSVRDFMEDFLASSDGDLVDQVRSAHFYEQYVALWEGRGGQRYPGIDRNSAEFLRQLPAKLFVAASANRVRRVNSVGETVGFKAWPVSNESRAEFALRVAKDLKSQPAQEFLKSSLDALGKLWKTGQADRRDLARLIESLTDYGLRRDDETFLAAKQCLLTEIKEADEYRAIASFVEKYPDELSPTEIDRLRAEFMKFAAEYADAWDDDPDWLRQIAADLEFVATRLEVIVTNLTQGLEEKANEIEAERTTADRDVDERDDWEPSSTYSDDVDDMFQGLREELES